MNLAFLYTDPSPSFSFRLARMRNTAGTPAGAAASEPASAASTPPASTTGTTPAAPSTSGTPGQTSASGSTPEGQAADEIQPGDWRGLRTKYDQVKTKASILDKLPVTADQLESFTTRWHGIATEASGLAKELGYADDDFKAAFEEDPIKTISVLRAEKQQAASRAANPQRPGESEADWEKRVQGLVDKATKPYTDHLNKQISDQVTAKIGTEFNTALDAALPKDSAPPEVRQLIEDYVTESLTYDNSALVAMKARGDFSRVKELVDFTVGRLKTVFAKWAEHERARGGQRGTQSSAVQGSQSSGKRPTLDEIINNPGVINEKYNA